MGLFQKQLGLYLIESKLFNKIVLWKHYYTKEKELYNAKVNRFLSSLGSRLAIKKDKASLFNHKSMDKLSRSIDKGKDFLLSIREHGLYWNGKLESNVGLNAQYILLKRFMAIDRDICEDEKIINYIIKNQNKDGSWSIYKGGKGHISYSILSYFALKVFGYSKDSPIMKRAKDYIINSGGIIKANVETRFWLAIYGQYPWKGLPPIPVQIMLAPLSFTFSIYNISYWCRTSLVPMSIIYNKKTTVDIDISIDELYTYDVDIHKITFDAKISRLFSLESILLQMSKVAKVLEKVSIDILDNISIKKAKDWILNHQDEQGDWGGIYPAIQYSVMALKVLGYDNTYGPIKRGLEALKRLQIESKDDIMLSPCTSPVWDTAWSLIALNNIPYSVCGIDSSVEWLFSKQIFREGDWCIRNPNILPGGWSFQFNNDFYPDVDDTAVVLMAILPNIKNDKHKNSVKVGINWVLSMQNSDGGWGAFERNVNKEIMNYLPINDIKNFLDQSTSDVTGRVIELLGKLDFSIEEPIIRRAINFIKTEQENFGAWYGRWGVNYIYGTWSVIRGLVSIKENINSDYIQKAIAWLKGCQNPDGGWGESCLSYEDIRYAGKGESTPSQTAWALMTLVDTNEAYSESVNRAIAYLLSTQNKEGGWDEELYTGTGFEKAFYLRYDYYSYYFPILALVSYYNKVS